MPNPSSTRGRRRALVAKARRPVGPQHRRPPRPARAGRERHEPGRLDRLAAVLRAVADLVHAGPELDRDERVEVVLREQRVDRRARQLDQPARSRGSRPCPRCPAARTPASRTRRSATSFIAARRVVAGRPRLLARRRLLRPRAVVDALRRRRLLARGRVEPPPSPPKSQCHSPVPLSPQAAVKVSAARRRCVRVEVMIRRASWHKPPSATREPARIREPATPPAGRPAASPSTTHDGLVALCSNDQTLAARLLRCRAVYPASTRCP
jgi:hypothetical protein